MTPILGKAQIDWPAAQKWAQSRKARFTCVQIAPLYWWFGSMMGVRADVAYAQMCKETGFGTYGERFVDGQFVSKSGVLDESFHNPCGLKTPAGGPNDAPSAHTRFEDWWVGIVAHLEHLALYAGAPGYPLENPTDPRHFTWIYGTAEYVENLSGRWAPSPSYGSSLVALYLEPMLAYRG